MTRKLPLPTTKCMSSHQSNRILPSQSHLDQKCMFHIPAAPRRWKTCTLPRTRIRIRPTPRKRPPQIQSVINGRLTNDRICGCDPVIGSRKMRIPFLVQQGQGTIRAPDPLLQSGIGGMSGVEATVGTHWIVRVVPIVVHEVVGHESNDTS